MDLYKDRDSQIEAIEASFEAAKKSITKHESNKNIKPVEILPFFPDFQFWHMPCAHVIFDTEPTQRGKAGATTLDHMSLGMIRWVPLLTRDILVICYPLEGGGGGGSCGKNKLYLNL